jgi:hypothetical protein
MMTVEELAAAIDRAFKEAAAPLLAKLDAIAKGFEESAARKQALLASIEKCLAKTTALNEGLQAIEERVSPEPPPQPRRPQ